LKNNGFYFIRLKNPDALLTPGDEKFFPSEVFPFGSAEIELFIHEVDHYWNVTEKKTGCRLASATTMDEAQKDAHRAIDEYGSSEKFVELLKGALAKLAEGKSYDYEKKEWI